MSSLTADEGTAESHVQNLARWTHMWAAAAVLVLEKIEEPWDDEDPVGSIGRRDVLALVLIEAVRNTYRGARAALGEDDSDVLAYETSAPGIKDLRDRFAHFDEYVQGEGRAQRLRGVGGGLDLNGLPGLDITSSEGGGRGGHTINVKVVEAKGEVRYVLRTRTTVVAGRALARATLNRAGLLDARHIERCTVCR